MKKNILIATALTIVMAIPFSVFAATSDAPAAKTVRGFFLKSADMTEQQKADAKEFSQKMTELKKEYINKAVANGSMTQEEADAALKRLEEGKEFFGKGRAFGNGKIIDKAKEFFKDSRGKGGFDNRGAGSIQLNDQQKADLADAQKKMAGLHKEFLAKLVANGTISQDKADEFIKRMNEMAQKMQEKGMSFVMGMPMGGFGFGEGIGFFRMHGLDESKLTEQQKADLAEYSNKMKALREETIAKMVANGAITQEQADALNKRMEGMPKADMGKGPSGERGMTGRGPMSRGAFGKGMMEKKIMEKKN